MKHKKPNKNNGSIPSVVENAINEHTVGGYIIFYFNQNTGFPEQRMSFDTPAHAIALQSHVSDWSEAIRQANINNSVNAIQLGIEQLENMEEEPPDDDDDEKDE